MCEGLVLLREQGNCTARYWACPVCDQRFSTSKVWSVVVRNEYRFRLAGEGNLYFDRAFTMPILSDDSQDYLAHVELVHEELAVVNEKYVACVKCQSEVVGMYYASTKTPGHDVCFRCYQADLRGNW